MDCSLVLAAISMQRLDMHTMTRLEIELQEPLRSMLFYEGCCH